MTKKTTTNDELTIMKAMVDVVKYCEDRELKNMKFTGKYFTFLREQLGLSNIQVVLVSLLVDNFGSISSGCLCDRLGLNNMQMLELTVNEFDALEEMDLIQITKDAKNMFGECGDICFSINSKAVSRWAKNKPFKKKSHKGLTEKEFVSVLSDFCIENHCFASFRKIDSFAKSLCQDNPDLPISQTLKRLDDRFTYVVMAHLISDYVRMGGTDGEGLSVSLLNRRANEEFDADDVLKEDFANGTHPLQESGLVDFSFADGMVDTKVIVLTDKAKELILGHNEICTKKQKRGDLIDCNTISEKPLFYNEAEAKSMAALTNLLSQENFAEVQRRLVEKHLPKGFACLFHGGPGTGKTEGVMQLARLTGRDIMMVDLSSVRDKYVGESEKNIKKIFTNYREACAESDVMPILLFNEADGIMCKRTEKASHHTDKMENTIQTIILNEMENNEGIIILTTNLATSMDPALSRRILYKIAFNTPNAETRKKIWQSMMPQLCDDDATLLANKYQYSGGLISNIVRKAEVEYVLSGNEPSLSMLLDYCDEEVIDDHTKVRKICGFAA